MKTFKSIILMKASMMKLTCIFLFLTLFTACEKDQEELKPHNWFYTNIPYAFPQNLSGLSYFDIYTEKEHSSFANKHSIVLKADAILTHKKDHDYILVLEESMPQHDGSKTLYRKISFDVKILPDGAVKFPWPKSWFESGKMRVNKIDQLLNQTGCIVCGPCIENGTLYFEGNFDGTNFNANTEFKGTQVNPNPEMESCHNIDGLLKFQCSFTLKVNKTKQNLSTK